MTAEANTIAPYVPVIAASITAVVSAIVAWFTARRSVRVEVDKLKLSAQQKLLEQLVSARLEAYPPLYALISDLVKLLQTPNSSSASLCDLLEKLETWDSNHAILLGPYTSNVCYDFRKALKKAVTAYQG